MVRNAMGWGEGVSAFPENITKMCGSMLLALCGVGWGSNFQKKALRNTSKAPKKKNQAQLLHVRYR